MTGSILVWTRRLGAAFAMLSTAVPVAAQNVLIRNAPPGAVIEMQVGGGAARSASADGNGDALVAVGFPSSAEEIAVRLAIDVCAAAVRVYVSSAGSVAPAAAAGCNRTTVSDRFAMRRVTTFLVEIQGTAVSLHLTQGPPPPSWLNEAQGNRAARPFQPPPSVALVASGGLGIAKFGSTIADACGDLSSCSGDDVSGVALVGATVWLKSFLGGQVTLMRPGQASASGSGDTFRFNTTLDTKLVTLAAAVGVRTPKARLYGLVGTNHHQATLLTTQTISDVTVGTGNAAVTTPGGTQAFEQRTDGWNWLFGGGVEAWPTRRIGFYVEMQRATLKATEASSTEGGIDDHLTFVTAGVRVRLW